MLKSTLSVVLSLFLAMSCFSQRMTIQESTGDTLLSSNEKKAENTCVAKAEKSQQVTRTQYLSNSPFQGENSTNSYSVFYEFNIPELEIEPFDYGNNSRTEFLRVKE